jgi:hypothetical protein
VPVLYVAISSLRRQVWRSHVPHKMLEDVSAPVPVPKAGE